MNNKNVLISGAGIAGLTLAYWLKKFGFHPTVIEHFPQLRGGGYAIDFWGTGFYVAEKMNIVPDLRKADLGISELAFVDKDNKRKGGLDYRELKKLTNNRALTLLRSDLSKIIYNHLDKDIEIIFGDTISNIEQYETEAAVSFKSGSIRSFDLVIGADGLHSIVRKLVFGNEAQFEKYYGYYTASFTIENSISDSGRFLLYNIPDKQAAVYAISEDKTATFFIFSSPQKLSYNLHDYKKQKEILRSEYEKAGWKCAEVLSKMDTAPDFYFDVVSQIKMSRWYKDRVTLVGDACDCPSLLSGQGSTFAMVGAYILAGELKEANGNYKLAFQRYEEIFKPFIDKKQKRAQNFAKSLVPKSKFGIWMRNAYTRLMIFPFVSRMFVRQFMDENFKLKTYGVNEA
jgi:2-polyprenyl-6-methoxyphenol hydroxylase-like FAD-dependent oxidoreductase